ncbi:MAG: nicotinate-nucleotide--dimethylbenzimidazole phosphoribosyltransferase [Oscillospiraceae bacterium]|nr:nicotinate-nucleotide--dimethylbenzimidazole phosphoribosyltransferase [Oscillospiraceae bacterium]
MERLEHLTPPDSAAYAAAQKHWNTVAKPLGSLGHLEEQICRLAAVQRTPEVTLSPCCAAVLCADHGIVEEGVSQSGSEVTAMCARAIAGGTSNINAIAAPFGIEVIAADLGMKAPCPGVRDLRVGAGTRSFTQGPAMTRGQAVQAICHGMDLAQELANKGLRLVIAGEMGIGNTTSASAIASVLLHRPPREVTGRGAGLSDAGLSRKCAVIERGIAVNAPDPADPIGVLSALGGFEIAGMTGLFLGGAVYGITVIIDGVISAAAAAVAAAIAPVSRDYMLASHCSGEPAGEGLLALIGLNAPIRAGLRLGEGTGGVLLVPLLEGALAVYRSAHSFETLGLAPYEVLS